MKIRLIRLLFTSVLAVFLTTTVTAQDVPAYGKHDIDALLVAPEGTEPPRLDGKKLDLVLRDLWSHARSYPPKFANESDEERARSDARALAGLFDVMVMESDTAPTALIFRAARLYSLSHHLDLKGNATKADACYERLLATSDKKGHIHYDYGVFLGGSARPQLAVPHLTKARELGIDGAMFSLAMTHLTMGDTAKAKQELEGYLKKHPNNAKAKMVLDAINSGSIEMKTK